ncbi:hypothetical protein Leryth_022336 [Lithospermum erythrorhizon]|nr:hypothetical protein Leryth_022336 [Lithospermum erythrorhizon]
MLMGILFCHLVLALKFPDSIYCFCGVTSTPLWRNGPPEKPVLCNACGSRWRTKGSLANYTPLHARAEPDDLVDHRFSRLKNVSTKSKDEKILKRKQNYDYADTGGFVCDYNNGSNKVLDEDTSNRSSSGSAISNSESCAQLNNGDASDFTGPSQSTVWDSTVPSKKRTCVSRPKPSSVEKLTKDLYTILHEQQFSYLSGSSEEDLLFESDKPMVSVEIGHGSVLIRHPNSVAREEESEASSLSIDYKQRPANEAYSCLTTLPVHTINKGVNLSNIGTKKMKKPSGPELDKDQMNREKDQLEKLQILGHRNSPLRFLDLKDILSYDEFAGQLTNDEQQQLLKYLPSIDNSALPDSLKGMFESTLFKENISAFQKLLAEGVFDNTFSGASVENCRTLKRFVLCNLTKSKWVEKYTFLKDVSCANGSSPSHKAGASAVASAHSVNVKISKDGQCSKFSGANTMMKSPRRILMKTGTGIKEMTDNDNGSFLSPRSLFALPPESSSLVLDSLQYTDESSDQELLLDIPSSSSFPQAELLIQSPNFVPQASAGSSSVYQRPFQP